MSFLFTAVPYQCATLTPDSRYGRKLCRHGCENLLPLTEIGVISMTNPSVYSKLFACLYDEPAPVGNLGRGTHYSVMRSVEWLDVVRRPLPLPEIHDFAVIWDEDHDSRVIEAVERIYMAGLLSPIQFI